MTPRLGRIAGVFLRVCNTTFGGGDPTMAVLHNELVERHRWLRPDQYGLVYALARVTPGTNVLAFCAGCAWLIRGVRAALLAVAAGSLPSAALVLALAAGYEGYRSNPLITGAVAGLLAVSVGLTAAGSWQLIRPSLRLAPLALIACALTLQGLNPILLLLVAAMWGGLQPAAGFSRPRGSNPS